MSSHMRWFGVAVLFFLPILNAQIPVAFDQVTQFSPMNTCVHQSADVAGSSLPELIVGQWNPKVLLAIDTSNGQTVRSIALPGLAHDIAVGDLDGDGDEDIVVASSFTGPGVAPFNVSVVKTEPTQWTRVDVLLPTLGRPYLADMDGDGDQDVVVGRSLLINNGSGSFALSAPITLASSATQFYPGDFDGDGDTDLLAPFVGNSSGGSGAVYRILRQDGGLSFTQLAINFLSTVTETEFAVGDLNGDGKDDFVVDIAAPDCHRITSYIAGPAAVFSLSTTLAFAVEVFGLLPRRPKLYDISGDGLLDCALCDYASQIPSADYSPAVLLENDGQGHWNEAAVHGVASIGVGLPGIFGETHFFDADGDGDLDMAGRLGGTTLTSALARRNTAPSTAIPSAFKYRLLPNELPPNFNTPIYVGLFDAADGLMQSAQFVTTIAGSASLDNQVCNRRVVTRDYIATPIWVTTGTSGQFNLTVTHPASGITDTRIISIGDHLSVVSGNNQSATTGQVFANPLRAQMIWPTTLAPSFDVNVVFESIGSSPVYFGNGPGLNLQTTVVTDLNGIAEVTVRGGAIPGSARVRATSGVDVAVFDLTVTGTILIERSSPGEVGTYVGGDFGDLEIRALLPDGSPNVGETVVFSALSGGVSLSSGSAVTGADGRASVHASSSGSTGTMTVRAATSAGHIDFTLYHRKVSVTTTPTSVVLFYDGDHAATPLVFGIDLPLPAPGFVISEFGPIGTTIESPGPAFAALDGWGLFGPPDASIISGSGSLFVRTFTRPAPLGVTFAVQCYGYDTAYPYPQCVTVSNIVNVSL